MRTVYFDLETGGVALEHPIIQIAAIAVDERWAELETFERLVQFNEAECDPEALKINHYDPERWRQKATHPRGVVIDIQEFLNRHRCVQMKSKNTGKPYSVARLAGYNAVSFDGPRLKRLFELYGTGMRGAFLPAHPIILDVHQLALWHLQRCDGYYDAPNASTRLGDLCQHFGVEIDKAHDALSDVRATIALCRKLFDISQTGVAA